MATRTVKCPSCGQENVSKLKECRGCGADLVIPKDDSPTDIDPWEKRSAEDAVKAAAKAKAAAKHYKFICANCGSQGNGKTHTSGNILIEIILWLCFLIPGMIYSVWRLSTRAKVCSYCGSKELVPTNSPKGKKLVQEYQ